MALEQEQLASIQRTLELAQSLAAQMTDGDDNDVDKENIRTSDTSQHDDSSAEVASLLREVESRASELSQASQAPAVVEPPAPQESAAQRLAKLKLKMKQKQGNTHMHVSIVDGEARMSSTVLVHVL